MIRNDGLYDVGEPHAGRAAPSHRGVVVECEIALAFLLLFYSGEDTNIYFNQ